MPRKRPVFISRELTRHGRHVWYFKRNGKRIRLPDSYGTEEFWTAYNAALTGVKVEPKRARPETLRWLVERYKESSEFSSLRPSTRRMRDNVLKSVCEREGSSGKAGDKPFALISRKHIEDGMERRAPHAANNFRKIMNRLFKWAVKKEHLAVNPCAAVDPARAPTDGFHSWTIEQVGQFRQRHKVGTKARLAMDLLLFVGVRRSDVIRIGKQHNRAGVISIRTQKTGTWVHIPVFLELQVSIEATKTGDLAYLTTESGTPFKSAASFGNWFADRCDEAGLPKECRAHGLRKAGATIAADNGATAHEIMAMFGWSKLAMAEVYTREADKKRLARGAAERISNNAKSHLETGGTLSDNYAVKSIG